MKILITYASAGKGHQKAAEVIYDDLRRRNPLWDIRIIDALDHNPAFEEVYSSGYNFLINYIQFFWSFLFSVTAAKFTSGLIRPVYSFINRRQLKEFIRFVRNEKPDIVVSTHFLPSEIVAYLKRKKRINTKLITIITDFGVHPYWLSDHTDTYCVASEATKDIMLGMGVSADIVRVTGIPVGQKFNAVYKKEDLSNKLGLVRDKPVVLVITGSFGIGPIAAIVEYLHDDFQVIAVCAKNRQLYQQLSNAAYPNTKVYGFTDNIEELMAVADMIITKPGGLTIAELLAMELAPLFIAAIPGQESANARILQENGIGLYIKDVREIKSIALQYTSRSQQVKEAIRRFKKTNALGELYDVVCKSSPRAAG